MARRVEEWVQDQLELTSQGRVSPTGEEFAQHGSHGENADLENTSKRKHSSPFGSLQRKSARKDSRASDSQPGKSWLSLKDFEKLAYLTETLSDRYKDKNIEVEEFFNRPDTIRLINVPSGEEETFTVEGFTESSQLLPSESLDKWFSVENEEKARRLNLFLDALTEGCKGLSLEKKGRNSYWYLHNVKKAVNELKMNLCNAGSEKTSHSCAHSGDAKGKNKRQYCSYYEERLVNELVYNFVVGMTHSMRKSKGRQFLQKLLEAALYVCLNEEDLDIVKVTNVGSSVATHEGFPVKILEGAKEQEKHEGMTLPNLKSPGMITTPSAGTLDGSETGTPSVSSCGGQSSETRSSHCAGCIFPDIAVTSFKDPSAKYLVIGDVKSTELSKREMSQIWLEMIGAGMFQNVVFGVLINQFEGKIWKMTVNKENKTVKFSREIYYSFFQAADVFMFFRYLIAVLDYAHRNVSVRVYT